MQEYAQNSSFAIGNPCMAGNFRNDTHVLAEKEIHKNVMKNPSCRGETQITTGETRTTRETWTATFPSSSPHCSNTAIDESLHDNVCAPLTLHYLRQL